MKSQNEKEFKQLIKTYESLTLEQLQKENDNPDENHYFPYTVLEQLTGFGGWGTCTLCKPIRTENNVCCSKCVYYFTSGRRMSCALRENFESYHDIENAQSIESLFLAIQNRAKHMKEVYKQYLKQR